LQDPISKIPITKKRGRGPGGMAQGVGPEVKPQYLQKKGGGMKKKVQKVIVNQKKSPCNIINNFSKLFFET
jgi:hypothetical protein